MNPRRIIQLLVLAVVLVLTLLIVIRASRSHSPLALVSDTPLPPAVATNDPTPPTATLPPASNPAPIANAQAAEEFHAKLQRLLVRRDVRPNEAILTFANADAYRRFLARAQHRGLTVLSKLDALLTVRVRYDSLEALEADLRESGADYSDVAANSYIRIPQKPAKEDRAVTNEIPFRNSALSFLGVTADHATWGSGVRIAVLDSGVAPDPTFGGSRVQYLDIGLGTLPGSGAEDGHGTSVASLAAGLAADAPGVAPAATVLSIRVTDATGVSDIFTVAQAILAAVDSGVPIINLSLGGYGTNAALNSAIDYATAHGVVIVAAAGNDQAAQLAWPAADPRVVSVGAIDALAQQVTFSNSGPQLQIAAPGYGVQTAWLNGERVYVDGTSASAPFVAGAIAAVMSQNPALTAEQAWAVIRQTTSDAGIPGADSSYGAGVLNLDWAMNFNNPTRLDPAVSSHYYDSSHSEMDFVVQNRSAQSVRDLELNVDANGTTRSYKLPAIAAGASYVVKLPIDQTSSAAKAGLTFTTQLVTPSGMQDANPANNRLSSHLIVGSSSQ